MLLHLAEALGIDDLTKLTGVQNVPMALMTKAGHPAVGQVADAMHRVALPGDADPATLAVPQRVTNAWSRWNNSSAEKTAVADLLPDLLTDARTAARVLDGDARRRAQADLAQVYHLVQMWVAFQPRTELVWLAADRAMSAAQEADSPTAIAAAAWMSAHAHRSVGGIDAAEQVARECLTLLDPQVGGEQLAMYGELHISLATTYSQAGRGGIAWQCLDKASEAADALGPGYMHPWVLFSRASVDGSAVTVDADLFHTGEAIRRSDAVSLADIPSRTRRAVYLMASARAHLQRREYIAVVHLLGRAFRESSETTRHRPWARQTVLELMDRRGPVRDDARELAGVMGMLG
jgi:hypothetical protein